MYHSCTLRDFRMRNDVTAREGKVWSTVAYGYKSDNGYLAIDETEAEIVKEIYALSLSGMGTRTIANKLNERGVPTRKNKIFRSTI